MKIKIKEIENFIKNQSTHQIHTQTKINKADYNQITAKKIGMVQIDIADFSN